LRAAHGASEQHAEKGPSRLGTVSRQAMILSGARIP
jgi:hypothetical protein